MSVGPRTSITSQRPEYFAFNFDGTPCGCVCTSTRTSTPGLYCFATTRSLYRDLCAPMSEADYFAGHSIRPLEILCEFCSERSNFARRVGHRRAEIDRKAHFSAERESERREPCRLGDRGAVRLQNSRQQRLPVVRALEHGAAQHRDESAIESLALSVRLRSVRRRSRFVDAESVAELREDCGFELDSAIGMQLLRDAVSRDPLRVHCASDCHCGLIGDRNGFGPSGEAIDHREDRFRRRAERERVLAADDIDVQRGERLIGGQVSERRARGGIRNSLAIADFAGADERGDFGADSGPPESLRDAAKCSLVPVVRRLVQRTKHRFSQRRRDDDSSGHCAFVAVFEQIFLEQ